MGKKRKRRRQQRDPRQRRRRRPSEHWEKPWTRSLSEEDRLSSYLDYRELFRGPEYAALIDEVGYEAFAEAMDHFFYDIGSSSILVNEPELQDFQFPIDPYDFLVIETIQYVKEATEAGEDLIYSSGEGYDEPYEHILRHGLARHLTPEIRQALIRRLQRIARRARNTEIGDMATSVAIALDDPGIPLLVMGVVSKLYSDNLLNRVLALDELAEAERAHRDPELDRLANAVRRGSDKEPAMEAMRALAARGEEALPVLEELFYDEGLYYHDYQLMAALEAIGQIPSHRSLMILIQTMIEDMDEAAELAYQSLDNMPDLAEAYFRYALTKPEPKWEIALYGYEFLAKIKAPDAFELIAPGLSQADPGFHDIAAVALVELGDQRAIPLLRKFLQNEAIAEHDKRELLYVLQGHLWEEEIVG